MGTVSVEPTECRHGPSPYYTTPHTHPVIHNTQFLYPAVSSLLPPSLWIQWTNLPQYVSAGGSCLLQAQYYIKAPGSLYHTTVRSCGGRTGGGGGGGGMSTEVPSDIQTCVCYK